MLLLLVLLAIATPQASPDDEIIGVNTSEGKCTYWQSGDAYFENASGLLKYFKQQYKTGSRGVVLQIAMDAPDTCTLAAIKAAQRANYLRIIERRVPAESLP